MKRSGELGAPHGGGLLWALSLSRLADFVGDQSDVDDDCQEPCLPGGRAGLGLDRLGDVPEGHEQSTETGDDDSEHRPELRLSGDGRGLGLSLGRSPVDGVPVGSGISRPLQDAPGDHSHEQQSEPAAMLVASPAVQGGRGEDGPENEASVTVDGRERREDAAGGLGRGDGLDAVAHVSLQGKVRVGGRLTPST